MLGNADRLGSTCPLSIPVPFSDVIKQHDSKCVLMEQKEDLVLLARPRPPRLLICYSNVDGPAHIRAVMLLAAFIQQHMATQVRLDI